MHRGYTLVLKGAILCHAKRDNAIIVKEAILCHDKRTYFVMAKGTCPNLVQWSILFYGTRIHEQCLERRNGLVRSINMQSFGNLTTVGKGRQR